MLSCMSTESSKCGNKATHAHTCQHNVNPFMSWYSIWIEKRASMSNDKEQCVRSPSLPRVPLLQPDPELERRAELLSGQAQRPGHRDLHGGGPAPGPDRRRPGRRLDRSPFQWNRQVAVVGRKRRAASSVVDCRAARLFGWLCRHDRIGLERLQLYYDET